MQNQYTFVCSYNVFGIVFFGTPCIYIMKFPFASNIDVSEKRPGKLWPTCSAYRDKIVTLVNLVSKVHSESCVDTIDSFSQQLQANVTHTS